MSIYERLEQTVSERESWALRRRRGIPNNKKLFVLTCMDERIPVEQALGLQLGDAHIFRNAGGVVTDDVIRSAALTTNFFGTDEIVVLLHTECGMLTTTGADVEQAFRDKGIDVDSVQLDPALPELSVEHGSVGKWIRTFEDVDDAAIEQIALLRQSPLIPEHVKIHGYIWEVESDRLRRPKQRLSSEVNTSPGLVGTPV